MSDGPYRTPTPVADDAEPLPPYPNKVRCPKCGSKPGTLYRDVQPPVWDEEMGALRWRCGRYGEGCGYTWLTEAWKPAQPPDSAPLGWSVPVAVVLAGWVLTFAIGYVLGWAT